MLDYHHPKHLQSDPLEFVHHYSNPWDQEAVALLASVLAYGNVKQIRRSVQDALTRIQQISQTPSDFIKNLSNPGFLKKAQKVFKTFIYRFNSGADLVLLFQLLNQSWQSYGSLGGHFSTHLSSEDPNIGSALSSLIKTWKNQAESHSCEPESRFSYLLTSPEDGSCCKRWCMFLRWMGRSDSLDIGLWSQKNPLSDTFPKRILLKASQLVMPLDTHTARISQYLRLTHRKSMNWKAALEVTESLKKLDPRDPTRYDFALSRLGILDLCQRSYRKEICNQCQLLPVCYYPQKFRQASSTRKSSSGL